MVRLARILRDYTEAGSLNELLAQDTLGSSTH